MKQKKARQRKQGRTKLKRQVVERENISINKVVWGEAMSMGCLFTTIPQQRDNKQSEVWVRGEFDCSSFISAFIQELNYENNEARSKGKFLLFLILRNASISVSRTIETY